MKKFKLGIVVLLMAAFTGIANAGGVGYIDYAKVIDNYDYAKQVNEALIAADIRSNAYLDDSNMKSKIKQISMEHKTPYILVVGQKENPSNFLLMHAMGPNVAGVIGSAVAAGVFLSMFAK